ncbi:bifunctional phosphoribosylaminoimidazolecarboxamide formyltransferase/IMP cyclohydrolase [bacterium]|nr:bifunctional phosphoribosylaminoimidazolecarboxamide formyltransferase/IMP cyclohydrolase [bacterium]
MEKKIHRNALLSVTDKSQLASLSRGLIAHGFILWASGGTRAFLTEKGIEVRGVEDLTGFPSILGGRVKTLHPFVLGGVLGDPEIEGHPQDLEQHKIRLFDVVVVNFYDFSTRSRNGEEEGIEAIDIGGPTIVRAAAKNFRRVLVLTDPTDYPEALDHLGSGSTPFRRKMAQKAFSLTTSYDASILSWIGSPKEKEEPFPSLLPLAKEPKALRYGENPHQNGAVYRMGNGALADGTQHQGKPLSYNNYLDMDGALRALSVLPSAGAVVVKHANPTGMAVEDDPALAFTKAWGGDPRAAFGSVVALSNLTKEAALEISKVFVEVVLSLHCDDDALDILSSKKNLRVFSLPSLTKPPWSIRSVGGVALWQEADPGPTHPDEWSWEGDPPNEELISDLVLANGAALVMRSNAISLVKEGVLVGAGAGLTSRVGALEVALRIAGERSKGAVMGSDAFFPFRDGIDLAADHGVIGVVQPGGSIRDDEVSKAASEHGLPIAFTGRRHFNH